jgi:hypothetical protein
MKLLLRLILIGCRVAEIFLVLGLILAVAGISSLPNLVRHGGAQATISLRGSTPLWTFNARIPHSVDGNFSFDPSGTTLTKPAYGSVTLGPLKLDTDSGLARLPSRSADAEASVDHVEAMVTLKDSENAADALRSLTWPLGLGMVGSGLVSLAVIELMRRMFKTVQLGEVFTSTNVRRVFAIGWALIGYSLLRAATYGWLLYRARAWLDVHFVMSGYRIEAISAGGHPPLPAVGILILALAEVFRRGLRLQEDNRLTI